MATQSNVPMISEVSICNQALSWVGQHEITSLDQKHPSAQWCRNNYPFLRDAVLEERMWSFAKARVESLTANRDEWNSGFAHDVPQGWLQVFRVFREPGRGRVEFVVEDGKVICDLSKVYMWGVKRVTDTGKFSSLFAQALAARIAADMAIPLSENVKLQGDMWGLYQAKLADAAVRDGMQGTHEKISSPSLVNARAHGRMGTAPLADE